MSIAELYEIFKEHPQVTTDSRNCPEGSIFFALKGTNFNGNEYARQAIEQGCSYAIVDEAMYANQERNIFLVKDVLQTLQELAKYHRQQFKIPVIAITGTNGKTTTKELVTAVLSTEYNVLSTTGNYNNHIGVPLTLLRLKEEHEIAVIEMGANHVGEIKFLAEIAAPDFGMITNIGYAHIEGFGSFENIVKTKTELYDYLRTRNEGKVFIDCENKLLMENAEGLTKIEYGKKGDLFVYGEVMSNHPYLKFAWSFSQQCYPVSTHLVGRYNLPNLLAAVTIGKYFGVKSELVCKALEEYVPSNNRSQLYETEKNRLIIDAYNANPTSMMAALENFSDMDEPDKVVILGDMMELGEYTLPEHQKIVDYLINDPEIDEVYLIGENFSKTSGNFPSFKDINEFDAYLSTHPMKDKYILLKGSRGTGLEKAVDLL